MGKKRVVSKQVEGQTSPIEGKFKIPKKKIKKQVIKGIAYIYSSYNNTIITLTDTKGNVMAFSSAGNVGFKGTRKSTPFAATLAARTAAEKAKPFGLIEVEVKVNGIGPGREGAIRGLSATGLSITSIFDVTPIPHNGVKPPKPRRV